MEPGVPFALLGAVALLAVAGWGGLAATALVRTRRAAALLVPAGGAVLAVVDTITAQRFGRESSDLLQVGDVLTAVDGEPVRDAAELRALISGRAPGEPVTITYQRAGTPTDVRVTTTTAGDEGEKRAVIGVVTEEKPLEVPFDVTIHLQDVGGPSAGLMFTLGILDKLGADSLTGGKYVAGTGEISVDGTVGPIGGITQKLIAARRKGAVVFLVPAANCAEAATRPPSGLTLVKVGTLTDALDGLQAVRRGDRPETCAA